MKVHKSIRRRYNWIPDLPDHRDHKFIETVVAPLKLPTTVDLRKQCPPVVNQGQIGSCTGNALAGAFEFLELRELSQVSREPRSQKKPEVFDRDFEGVSRLFIYYNERALEGTVKTDSGAQLRDGVKTLAQNGVCRESTWKYQASLVLKKPLAKAYKEALPHRISSYLSIANLQEVKQSLALGYPVAFGFAVFESFESPAVAKTGRMPLPAAGESQLGGHAVLAVGYDDSSAALIVRNSWGADWGDHGYFYMPYAYIDQLKLALDFWTIRK
jgi:C1A family cysteine protease